MSPSDPHAVAGGLLWRHAGAGPEVALTYRGGRWGLPRGLVREGEPRRAAALRIVLEQTGHHARTESFAGATLSDVRGHPLSTWYWVMHPLHRDDGFEGAEHLVWATFEDALLRLDYPEERELLAATRPRASKRGWRRWLARLDGSGPRAAELRADIESARTALEARAAESAPWRDAALSQVARAEQYVEAGELERGLGTLQAARQLEARGMSASERALQARLLVAEASSLAAGWQRDGLGAALADVAQPDAETLGAALRARDEARGVARRARAELARRRLFLGLVLALAVLLVWSLGGARWFAAETATESLLPGVLLFGIIGATTGALARALRAAEPEPGPAWLRPLLGAGLALGAYALLASGLVALGTPSPPLLLAAAWLAGFGERWLPR